MKPILIIALLFVFSCSFISHGQSYIGQYRESNNIKSDTLVDIKTGIRFIVDSNRIYVKAIDKRGKQLWKTDPSVDKKLPEYRFKRPVIVYFQFQKSRNSEIEEIGIGYNNSQFGYIDKKTGAFQFAGQD
ncbi:hypothetical protein [Mucilaginibacter sp. L196]|uniref:hypothetical protein n=1 Tax=Mucilaginibacter sp. L196 TaxID=1641870 RepID=UPI00131AC491|nr:hypothetical protein [Mucilaginibacter sp. L196]